MNNNTNNSLQLAPVAGWELKQVPSLGMLILRLDFLSNAMQSPDEAHPGRNYVLQPAQARELAERILAGCDALESGARPAAAGPAH